MQNHRTPRGLALFVLISLFPGAAIASGPYSKFPELPAGVEELYLFGADKPESGCAPSYLTRKGELITPFDMNVLKQNDPTRFLFYSPQRGMSEFTYPGKLNGQNIAYCSWGLVAFTKSSVVAITYDGKAEQIYRGRLHRQVYANDDGLIVFMTYPNPGDGVEMYHVREPGKPLVSFGKDDPRCENGKYLIDPMGHVCEASDFDGASSPLKALREQAIDRESHRPRPAGAPVLPSPFLTVHAINDRYGIVYSLADSKTFRLFSYRKSDGTSVEVFQSPARDKFILGQQQIHAEARVTALADTGDMIVYLVSPAFKNPANPLDYSRACLYRRAANRLIEFNSLRPQGLTIPPPWIASMSCRGDVVFCAQKNGISVYPYSGYFLPADSDEPKLIEELARLPEQLGICWITADRKIYDWIRLSNGAWALGRVAAPADRKTGAIAIGAAAILMGTMLVWSWRQKLHFPPSELSQQPVDG